MNYLFFFADQFRAESAGCYGHPLVQTPNLDRLANEGTRFDQCHIQATLCSPSRCSLLTGWYPHVSGHRSIWHLLRPHEPNLFRYLRDAGYHVAAFGKNDVFARETIPLTCDEWGHPGGSARASKPYETDDPRYYSFLMDPVEGGPEATGDYACVKAGIDFLYSDRSRGKPFMLFLPILNPHPPYTTPQPFYDMHSPDELPPLRPVLPEEGMPSWYRHVRGYRRLNELDESFFRKINAVYLGMCSYGDWMLGRVLSALTESGHAEDTTVIFASDHGDFAGDYGLVEKVHVSYQDVMTRVPLVIRTPGGAASHVVNEPVELMDIMATVLDLSGIEARHTHFARSLVPQLRGEAGDPNRSVFAECGFNAREPHCFEGHDPECYTWKEDNFYYPQTRMYQEQPASISRVCMMRNSGWKYIRRPDDMHELYDLKNDPRETTNRFGDPACRELQQTMTEAMLDWYVRTADVVPQDDDARGWAT